MDPHNFQKLMEALLNHLERQDAQAVTTNDLLLQLVGEVRSTRQDSQQFQQRQSLFNQRMLEWTDRQEKFNDRQEKFNERQDQFNIIFLDEIRGMKKDIKDLTEVVLKQHEGRLKRLEDFMDGLMRPAS
ncbi:hypothetical protein IC235_20530 [Hymenobacter sp. BT664]|uniref:Uncharacterized protein n=1 Tax=Hymenobacter montanus TaxID=2771359 RepID=A0A927BHC7_9BACT|nr:hypothetical protein [Hymenobacter montanus]MBD2770280.1 hypothetical protein [Hymenobacter montanus]